MSRRMLSALVLLVALSDPANAIEALLPRHPAPSPDGSQIAFSWQGDLWLVPAAGGDARRVTAHPASESYPVWSRDGRLLAFIAEKGRILSQEYPSDDVVRIRARLPERYAKTLPLDGEKKEDWED